MVCPNCDAYLSDDEQLIILPSNIDNTYSVDHVSIFSEGSVNIKIEKKCASGIYTRLSFD